MQTEPDRASQPSDGLRAQVGAVATRVRKNTSVLLVLVSLVAQVVFVAAIAYVVLHVV